MKNNFFLAYAHTHAHVFPGFAIGKITRTHTYARKGIDSIDYKKPVDLETFLFRWASQMLKRCKIKRRLLLYAHQKIQIAL